MKKFWFLISLAVLLFMSSCQQPNVSNPSSTPAIDPMVSYVASLGDTDIGIRDFACNDRLVHCTVRIHYGAEYIYVYTFNSESIDEYTRTTVSYIWIDYVYQKEYTTHEEAVAAYNVLTDTIRQTVRNPANWRRVQ